MNKNIVLQKFIASSGHCSRRYAEDLIRNGKVKVNNEIAELGQRVGDDDEIKIGNKTIKIEYKKIYIKLNKPIGYVCTNRKFENEKNIFDILKTKERLYVAGRLDKNSRGLILLTNDGELTQKLTHPKFQHKKEYEVKINDKLKEEEINDILDNFKKGIDIGDGDGVVHTKEINHIKDSKFRIILTEGKKRQIRRMFGVANYNVEDLVRVGISNLKLDNLKEGEWEYLSDTEIKSLIKE